MSDVLRWICLFLVLAFIAAMLAFCGPVKAAEAPHTGWFDDQIVPKGATNAGGRCCDEADAHKVKARFVAGHWEALWGDTWIMVPNSIVLDGPSFDGNAWLWVYLDNERCFVPPDSGT